MKIKIIALFTLTLAACGVNTAPGDGSKVGQIVKLAKLGMFAKTYEAEIIRGGFQNGSGANGQAFDFTIETEELAKQVKDAMDAQTEVIITYRSEGLWSACRSEGGGNFLTSIRPLK